MKGTDGANGTNGTDGADGADGKSAFEVYKAISGNENKTQTDYLASLKGDAGATGAAGSNGKSAFELWLDTNSGGTQAQYEASLKGADGSDGKSAYEVWEEIPANDGKSESDYIASLKGDAGANGTNGTNAALAGAGDPNGSVTGVAGQFYVDTATGKSYSTVDGTAWLEINSDTQDLSLSDNTISLVDGGSIDLSNSTLATSVAANTTKEGSKWENDTANTYVKLRNQSDGSTAKPNASNIFLHDSGQVSINTTNKNSSLTVAGSMAFQLRIRTLAAGQIYTIQDDDYTLVITQGSSIGAIPSVSLPSAAAFPGRVIRIVNRGLLGLGLDVFSGSGDEIKGGLGSGLLNLNVLAIVANNSMTLQSSGVDWYVISSSTLN